MDTILTYSISLVVIVISVCVTLYFKSELERMFRETKEVFVFHICNVLIILMTSFVAQAVMTVYIFGNELKWMVQLVLLLLIIIPIYILGYIAFEASKYLYRKYDKAENGKVLIINEKYLRRR